MQNLTYIYNFSLLQVLVVDHHHGGVTPKHSWNFARVSQSILNDYAKFMPCICSLCFLLCLYLNF